MSPVGEALVGYVVVFASAVGASLLAAFIVLSLYPAETARHVVETVPGLLTGGFASASALLAVALIGTRRPRGRRLRLVAGRASGVPVLVMVIGALALGQALESLPIVLGLGSGSTLGSIRRALTDTSGGMLALAVLAVGVFAGFAEELFFRGFMQTRLRERWEARWAIAATALGFGLLQMDRVHASLVFLVGLYLGFITEVSVSIVPAIVCHVANNASSIVLTAFFGGTNPDFLTNLFLLLVMTAVVVAAVVAIRFLVPPPRSAVGGPGSLRIR